MGDGSAYKFDLFQKQSIMDECTRRNVHDGRVAINGVCEWAVNTLHLPKKPSYKAVFAILKDLDCIVLKASSKHSKMKKELVVRSISIQNELVQWV